ncbi:MAG: DUF5054 domain-containing protein [Armatimonadota bacterium]
MPKHVHVIFKTHLDVGFTDYAGEVLRKYIEQYIPQAIRLARQLREKGHAERFIWTTGSWLIYEYLERVDPTARREMEQAILAGDIRWHALPFTTHSELMDPGLFKAGIGLSQTLDCRFGMTTIAAKMTDVPGHTRGIVPLMAAAGVRFLHIGVNPACPSPEVPDVFRWRDAASQAELLVMYHKNNYGSAMTIDGLDHAIAFAHTGDNNGPQSAEQIIEQYSHLRQQFPADNITASTMEPFAHALLDIRDQFPVVEDELGDTWIHGVGTDPQKVAQFRELSRLRNTWLAQGADPDDPAVAAFTRSLLVIPEHTWGMDEKTHLADYSHYTRCAFAQARAKDRVDEIIPEAVSYATQFKEHGAPQRFSRFEASWTEQRDYITQAVDALHNSPVCEETSKALTELTPVYPDDTMTALFSGKLETAHFTVQVDQQTGALTGLCAKQTGKEWAGIDNPLGLFRYETFSAADYDRYLGDYAVNMEHRWCCDWAIPDFSKPGLQPEDSEYACFLPSVQRLLHRREADADYVLCELHLPESVQERYGAPRHLTLEYRFPDAEPVVEITLQWFNKSANRMPEACWLSFTPAVTQPNAWHLDKLGTLISPLEVVPGGNRNLHAVSTGACYAGTDGQLTLETLDAALIAPGTPRLLQFDRTQPDLTGGMHINLYNNIWGTNFPMWYEDDARFRVTLRMV